VTSFLLKGSLALPDEEDMRRAQAAQSQAEAQRRAQASRLRTNNNQQQTETQEAAQRAAQSASHNGPVQRVQPIVREKVVGRNDPCPCGSGKKYKQCHGKFELQVASCKLGAPLETCNLLLTNLMQ
jgi:uncharacterized protein YecA (UPF0149 family)